LGNYPKSINAFSLNDWFDSKKDDPVLIDVREHSELEIARFSKEFYIYQLVKPHLNMLKKYLLVY